MPRSRNVVIWALVVLTATAAGTWHGYGVVPLAAAYGDVQWVWLALVTTGFLASELQAVYLRFGKEAYAFTFSEVPMVIGLYFVRPDLLVAARLVGAVLAFVWQRKDPQKAAFNCAMFALETTGAVWIWAHVLGGADPLGPRGWLATALVVLYASLLSSTMVSAVIIIATGAWPRRLGEVFSLGELGDLANAAFALNAVYILTVDWRAVWLLLAVVSVLVLAFRSYDAARQRSESLEQVNRFTELVGREVEVDAVARTVLLQVRAAFDAGVAELRLASGSLHPGGWHVTAAGVEAGQTRLTERLTEGGGEAAILVARGTRAEEHGAALQLHGVRDAMAVPMRSEGTVVGHLVVADKLGDVATFTAADLRQLHAFANHAAVALTNALRAAQIIEQARERERQALHDELTGLANRRLLGLQLTEALAGDRAALLLLDLDRFREVNETLGHEIGDRLLCLVADRLTETLEGATVVARVGGDEFAAVLAGADEAEAVACAVRVGEALARPFDLNGLTVAIQASVGVADGARGADGVSMHRWADMAMNVAKDGRSGFEVYRREMDRTDSGRLGLLADLRVAVADGGLCVCYQPKVDTATGRVSSAEALVRWFHPALGSITPDDFIPLAEHSALITPLTMVVLADALRECRRWQRQLGQFSVAVNISQRSLVEAGFVEAVARTLGASGAPPGSLTLEITESSLMTDPDRALAALAHLRDLGVHVSVDDLGTGYSSLSYLQRLPVDEVKIDRSFLSDISDARATAVLRSMVELGHRLGHRVVAEGVEDEATYHFVATLGCDEAQGFWLGRPMPAAELTACLDRWQPPRRYSAASA